MIESQYPPLPEHVDEHPHTGAHLFSEQQMRAYIDADRAQRKPLTDAPQLLPPNGWIDPDTGTRVPTWEQIHEAWYRIGADIHGLSWEQFTTALRKENTVMVPPPRPDAGNN